MLKAGGWIISQEVAFQWFNAYADTVNLRIVKRSPHTPTQVVLFWQLRNNADSPPPFKLVQAEYFAWPKMTPDDCGKCVCFLVSRLYRTSTETWNRFTPLSMRGEDNDLFERCKRDGLKLGEWITVPDPWENDWPFVKRHPGRKCPPDPVFEAMRARDIKAEKEDEAKKQTAMEAEGAEEYSFGRDVPAINSV